MYTHWHDHLESVEVEHSEIMIFLDYSIFHDMTTRSESSHGPAVYHDVWNLNHIPTY
jgi:hypothetical protein